MWFGISRLMRWLIYRCHAHAHWKIKSLIRRSIQLDLQVVDFAFRMANSCILPAKRVNDESSAVVMAFCYRIRPVGKKCVSRWTIIHGLGMLNLSCARVVRVALNSLALMARMHNFECRKCLNLGRRTISSLYVPWAHNVQQRRMLTCRQKSQALAQVSPTLTSKIAPLLVQSTLLQVRNHCVVFMNLTFECVSGGSKERKCLEIAARYRGVCMAYMVLPFLQVAFF